MALFNISVYFLLFNYHIWLKISYPNIFEMFKSYIWTKLLKKQHMFWYRLDETMDAYIRAGMLYLSLNQLK